MKRLLFSAILLLLILTSYSRSATTLVVTASIIPSTSTLGDSVIIVANVSPLITDSNGSVTYSFSGGTGTLSYQNGLWIDRTANLTRENYQLSKTVTITAATKDGTASGSTTINVALGNLTVNFDSPTTYNPSSPYVISISAYTGNSPKQVTNANYFIRYANNFSLITQGTLGCSGTDNTCSASINPSNWGDIVIEVEANASNYTPPINYPPKWSNPHTGSGTPTIMTIDWVDGETGVSKVLIEHNGNGTPVNYTASLLWGNTYFSTYSFQPGTYQWRSFANDTQNAFNVSLPQTFTITSPPPTDNPPTWQSAGSNTTTPPGGTAVKLYVKWSDDFGLSKAILETNETGTFKNKTTYGSPMSLSGTSAWSNFTWQNASVPVGTTVAWRVYANDTSNQSAVTTTQTFTVVCYCTPWGNAGDCGDLGCPQNYIPQTRTCTPSGCSAEFRCVYKSYCSTSNIIVEGENPPVTGFYIAPTPTTLVGGGYFYVSQYQPGGEISTSITTDKDSYVPDDLVSIDLFTNNSIDSATFSINKPDGSSLVSDIPMDAINATHYHKNYTLGHNGADTPNGTYVVKASAIKGGNHYDATKNIDIIPWQIFLGLDKLEYAPDDVVKITVETSNAYRSNLNFTINISVFRLNAETYNVSQGTITGNKVYNATFTVPSNVLTATFRVEAFVNDSDGRTATLQKNFYVGTTPPTEEGELSVTPRTWSVTTVTGKVLSSDFIIQNTKNQSVTKVNVTIPTALRSLVSVVSKPNSIATNSNGTLRLKVDTNNVNETFKSGTITIDTNLDLLTVSANIRVVGDLTLNATDLLSKLSALNSNITLLEQQGKNTSEIRKLYNETKDLLEQVRSDYENEDYASAYSKLTQSQSKFNELQSLITGAFEAPTDYGNVIWGVAVLVVVVIVGFIVYKFRHKIMEFINKIRGKEEEFEEVYYKEGKGYRTEYY